MTESYVVYKKTSKGISEKRDFYNVNGHLGELVVSEYEHINMTKQGKRSGWYPCLALIEIGTGRWLNSRRWKLSQRKQAIKDLSSYPHVLPGILAIRCDVAKVSQREVIAKNPDCSEIHFFDNSLTDRQVADHLIPLIDKHTTKGHQFWSLNLQANLFGDPIFFRALALQCGMYHKYVALVIKNASCGNVRVHDCL